MPTDSPNSFWSAALFAAIATAPEDARARCFVRALEFIDVEELDAQLDEWDRPSRKRLEIALRAAIRAVDRMPLGRRPRPAHRRRDEAVEGDF